MKSAVSREFDEIRAQYEARYLSAWARSDELFGLIRDDRLLSKPIVWRHPFLFYVGHLPAFSWNQICGSILKWQSFNPHFDELFCRGIDPDVDTGECHWHPEVPDEWPTLKQTMDYRDRVRGVILEALDVVPRGFSNDVMAQGGRVFDMVLEHEYMHQETLLYMMQELPLDKKGRPARAPRYAFNSAPASRSIHIPAGKARLGARFNELDFGWDNEFSAIAVDVPAFDIDSLPVTNGEFFEFVESGNYDQERFWLPADWKWKQLENKRHPNCWMKQEDSGFIGRCSIICRCRRRLVGRYTLASPKLGPSPVGGAKDYRRKRSFIVLLSTALTEERCPILGANRRRRCATAISISLPGLPAPVGSHPAGASRWGVGELIGNGWELTDTCHLRLSRASRLISPAIRITRKIFSTASILSSKAPPGRRLRN